MSRKKLNSIQTTNHNKKCAKLVCRSLFLGHVQQKIGEPSEIDREREHLTHATLTNYYVIQQQNKPGTNLHLALGGRFVSALRNNER